MPNQLAKNKRRKSVAEHEAVLAALEEVARIEGISTMALMREAIRDKIRKHVSETLQAKRIRQAVMSCAPRHDTQIDSPSQLLRLKRSQRAFDQILLDLKLTDPENIESKNSIVAPQNKIRILELEHNNVK